MRLAGLSHRGLLHLGSSPVVFGPGLNVVEADVQTATALLAAIKAALGGPAPATSQRPTDEGLPLEGWHVELDLEMDDGSLIRCERDRGADGDTQRVSAVPSDRDITADFLAGRLSVSPWLSVVERNEIARLGALLHDDTVDQLLHAPTDAEPHRWWHVLNGWQFILSGAVGIAIGAFIWPQSKIVAVVVGVILALAIALVLLRLAKQQWRLTRRRMLLNFGVHTTDELAERVEKLQALEKRLQAEETSQAVLADFLNAHPSFAGWDAQLLGVSSASGIAPVWISDRIERTAQQRDQFDASIEATLREFARSAQCMYYTPSSREMVVSSLHSGDPVTRITLME